MLPEKIKSFAVIGAGAVGTSLAALLQDAGCELKGFSTRTEESLQASRDFLDLPGDVGRRRIGSWCGAVDLLLITVPDDRIRPVAEELACEDLITKQTLVVHCSGAHTARDLLEDLASSDVPVGSFHPLQTVPDPRSGVKSIPGSWVAVGGSDEVTAQLENLARKLDCSPVVIPEDKRPLYHASAVVACNLTIALFSIAGDLMKDAAKDLDEPLAPLRPLVEQSIRNVFEKGPEEALTGPALRGDRDTLHSHVNALGDLDPEFIEPYMALTRKCLDIGRETGRLDPEQVEDLLHELKTHTSFS